MEAKQLDCPKGLLGPERQEGNVHADAGQASKFTRSGQFIKNSKGRIIAECFEEEHEGIDAVERVKQFLAILNA